MKKRKPRFAQPDPEQDKSALAEFYEKNLLAEHDVDPEGMGINPKEIDNLATLAKTLKGLKRKKP